MANSNTAHSKQLRAKTAAEHRKKQLAEGKIKTFNITLKTDIAERFDTLAKQQGLSRPALIEHLLNAYES